MEEQVFGGRRWGDPEEAGRWAAALLGEHRASRERIARLGLRPLGPGLRALIWALRVYVLLMVVLTVVSVLRAP
ncbi:protein of unknown function [Candidatus Hydrogenisulfobacillus filiaventi]|uniref:Uncharacterized protein n=1 Tax=Candidatus Hydrogenisulfobacillus filiaventi TaxID=2707344 RepID=A0A6F8ZER6_9FIRM|nr:hypothetical protein [Bacillota bacterium]CAB1128245.1 protein of unknown function [Candidatus Hydrogenisulfobacillus filiaventi]